MNIVKEKKPLNFQKLVKFQFGEFKMGNKNVAVLLFCSYQLHFEFMLHIYFSL